MTIKKENIINAALELFAKDGFKSTSTSKVAKHAGVSEGLIFRHFKNKEGLLEAIIHEGDLRAKDLFADIVLEVDPKEVLRKTLNLKNTLSQSNGKGDFWKLQYKLKWELETYGEKKMDGLELALTHAFKKLGYSHPTDEAMTFLLLLDGAVTRFYLQANFDFDRTINYLYKKYEL